MKFKKFTNIKHPKYFVGLYQSLAAQSLYRFVALDGHNLVKKFCEIMLQNQFATTISEEKYQKIFVTNISTALESNSKDVILFHDRDSNNTDGSH